jgi:uncharacterized protein YgiB involved in biofilm formation
MKQNKVLRRTIVGSTAFAMAITLSGCEDDRPNAVMFSSAEQCKDHAPEGAMDWVAQCTEAFTQAQEEHAKIAPRYDSLEVCETAHGSGNCYQPISTENHGSGFFGPFMTGYLVSNILSSSSHSGVRGRALYPSSSGKALFTSDGKKAGSVFGTKPFKVSKSVSAKPNLSSPPKVLSKTSVKSTGGFGSSRTVSSRSSGRFGG